MSAILIEKYQSWRRPLRVAVLEDDPDQGRLIVELLKNAGHNCEHFDNSRTFIQHIKRESFDVLVLDWLVPEMSGLEVLRWARTHLDWRIPVLFLTTMEHEEDIVRALEYGADDYMIKPVKARELVARIAALARRTAAVDDTQEVLEFPPFSIDRQTRTLKRDGVPVELTQKEYELVLFMFRNAGRVLSRGHILESVWGRSPNINTRTVDTHVSRIRSKLGLDTDSGWRLTSIYQHGYRLERLHQTDRASA